MMDCELRNKVNSQSKIKFSFDHSNVELNNSKPVIIKFKENSDEFTLEASWKFIKNTLIIKPKPPIKISFDSAEVNQIGHNGRFVNIFKKIDLFFITRCGVVLSLIISAILLIASVVYFFYYLPVATLDIVFNNKKSFYFSAITSVLSFIVLFFSNNKYLKLLSISCTVASFFVFLGNL